MSILNRPEFEWSMKYVFYRLDWNTASAQDVKQFLRKNYAIAKAMNMLGELPKFTGKNRDNKVMQMFNWVVKNIQYQTDDKHFGIKEKWGDVDITLLDKAGDCEDMAILLFSLARINGIDTISIRIVAGEVIGTNGLVGHCWVEYAPDCRYDYKNDKQVWVILDPAYDGQNKTSLKTRLEAKQDVRYVKRWWMVTDL